MAKKIKIPKTFAGAKLPKALRRGLRDLAASETGRATVVKALTTATAAVAVAEPKAPALKAKKVKPATVSPAAAKRRKPASGATAATAKKPGVTETLIPAESTEAPPLATTPPSTSTH